MALVSITPADLISKSLKSKYDCPFLCFRSQAPLDEFFTLATLGSLAIGLITMLSSLRCFGSNRTTFWR